MQVEWCPRHPGDKGIRRGSLIAKFVREQQAQKSPVLPNGGHEDVIQVI
jgi:hypothetical protein